MFPNSNTKELYSLKEPHKITAPSPLFPKTRFYQNVVQVDLQFKHLSTELFYLFIFPFNFSLFTSRKSHDFEEALFM